MYVDRFTESFWDLLCRVETVDEFKTLVQTFLDGLHSTSAKRLAVTSLGKLLQMSGIDTSKFKFRVPKKVKGGVKHLTPEQISSILKESRECKSLFLSARNPAILAVFSYLGLRLSELWNLTTDDIDFQNNKIRILGKGNKLGYVPIIKAVYPYLEWWLHIRKDYSGGDALWITEGGNKLSKRAIQYVVTGYVKPFDENLSTHSLRHTAATTLINKGVGLKTVSTLLRHTNLSTTADIYAHQSVEAVGEDMDKVYGG